MEEQEGTALEVEASEGLTEAEVVAKATAAGARFALVAEEGTAVGVLVVSDLADSSRPVIRAARATPAITEQTVPIELPDGETLKVNVVVQGADLALWDRGHERLVMPLAGRTVAAALSSHVMAFAAPDIKLPTPNTPPLPRRNHTYVCPEKHYEKRTSDDPDRVCGQCGRKLYRV